MIKTHAIYAVIVVALAGALWYAIERTMEAEETAAKRAQTISRQNQDMEQAEATRKNQRESVQRLQERIASLSETRDRIQQDLAQARTQREKTEATDEDYRVWGNTDLPSGAIRLLNNAPLHPEAGTGSVPEPDRDRSGGSAPEAGGRE